MHLKGLTAIQKGSAMLYNVRLKELICYHFGLLLFLVGLHQAEGAASEMANLNWKPFVYGGMASIVAEFGESVHLLFSHYLIYYRSNLSDNLHLFGIYVSISKGIECILMHTYFMHASDACIIASM